MSFTITNDLQAKRHTTITSVHIDIIKSCLNSKSGIIFQKDLSKKISKKVNSSTISRAKTDLITLGILKETSRYNTNELFLIKGTKPIAKTILRWASELQTSLLIRPHHITIDVRVSYESRQSIKNFIKHLPKNYNAIKSHMNNNVKYIITHPSGSIELQESGTSITFHINDFIIPVDSSFLDDFERFIKLQIQFKFNELFELLAPVFEKRKIYVEKIHSLRKIHIGILMKRDAYRLLNLSSEMEQANMFRDKSVKGLYEIEKEGPLQETLDCIKRIITIIFDKWNNKQSKSCEFISANNFKRGDTKGKNN
ncbi:MAG: hypothetical protein ACOCP4_04975 [Candidatus Woesearchaeota archaeon]